MKLAVAVVALLLVLHQAAGAQILARATIADSSAISRNTLRALFYDIALTPSTEARALQIIRRAFVQHFERGTGTPAEQIARSNATYAARDSALRRLLKSRRELDQFDRNAAAWWEWRPPGSELKAKPPAARGESPGKPPL
jgi:phosphoglycolate phosphatase-like HAD superfamily hydrolase